MNIEFLCRELEMQKTVNDALRDSIKRLSKENRQLALALSIAQHGEALKEGESCRILN